MILTRHFRAAVCLCFVTLFAGCPGSQAPAVPEIPAEPAVQPPVAAKIPYTVKSPHGDRVDEYYWMRDDTRKKENVLAHLRSENAYASAQLAATVPLQETIYSELIGRLKQDDSNPPTFSRGYYYYSRFETGKERPIYARKMASQEGGTDSAEEIVLDTNQLAVGHSFYRAIPIAYGPKSRLMAYVEDTVGRREWVLKMIDLETRKPVDSPLKLVSGGAAFSEDGQYLFYVVKDAKTLRSDRVLRHKLGTDSAGDVVVYEEKDNTFNVGLGKTASRKFITVGSFSTTTTEFSSFDAFAPTQPPVVLIPRQRDHEYSIDHIGDQFVIKTNLQAKNFRIVTAPTKKVGDTSAWTDVVPHRADTFISDYDVTETFIATEERSGGMLAVNARMWKSGKTIRVGEPSEAGTTWLLGSSDPSVNTIRILYTDLVTPRSTFDVDPESGAKTLVKQQPVLGNFDASLYATERVWVPARDGANIPVSLAYRKDQVTRNGESPALLYGYGSYGSTRDPSFSTNRLSLLDRGFVYAIAHVRGSEALGRQWYEDGKLLKKKNTFTDFIDVTEFLVSEKWASANKMTAIGGSAGGLLMGAIVNLRPDLYRAVISHVPFVDVMTTMLDEDIPLTTGEFDEWGDPKKKTFYDYMLSYSPYDNVKAQAYPTMLVTTGLHDSQVQYFEPAKWVARLRDIGLGKNPIIFTINMEAGHGGKSGRFEKLRETARDYAFLIHTIGTKDSRTP